MMTFSELCFGIMSNLREIAGLPKIVNIETTNENPFETMFKKSLLPGGKFIYIVQVDKQTVKLAGANALSYLIGHELAHIECDLRAIRFPRHSDEEIYADCRSMELIAQNGVNPYTCIDALRRYGERFGFEFTGDNDHPNSKIRIAECRKYLKRNPWIFKRYKELTYS